MFQNRGGKKQTTVYSIQLIVFTAPQNTPLLVASRWKTNVTIKRPTNNHNRLSVTTKRHDQASRPSVTTKRHDQASRPSVRPSVTTKRHDQCRVSSVRLTACNVSSVTGLLVSSIAKCDRVRNATSVRSVVNVMSVVSQRYMRDQSQLLAVTSAVSQVSSVPSVEFLYRLVTSAVSQVSSVPSVEFLYRLRDITNHHFEVTTPMKYWTACWWAFFLLNLQRVFESERVTRNVHKILFVKSKEIMETEAQIINTESMNIFEIQSNKIQKDTKRSAVGRCSCYQFHLKQKSLEVTS
jgi:hypothetical protein